MCLLYTLLNWLGDVGSRKFWMDARSMIKGAEERPWLHISNSLVCFSEKQTVLAAIVSFDDYLHTLRVSLYDYIGNYFLVLERITYNTNNVHAYKDTTAAIESQQSNLPKFTVQSVSSWE
jgi:hypothetical protein